MVQGVGDPFPWRAFFGLPGRRFKPGPHVEGGRGGSAGLSVLTKTLSDNGAEGGPWARWRALAGPRVS